MSSNAKVAAFIRGASKLPVLPGVTTRLFTTIDSPESSAREVAGVIETDPALAARLLKLANSSFYGRRGQISTVRHAVVVLGSKTIRSLALTVWTHTLRSQVRDPEELRLITPVFSHGLTTAVAAGLLAVRFDRSLEEDSFMAGLLHDIGRVALFAQLGKAYQSHVLDRAIGEKAAVHAAEEKVLGFDHRDLGAELMHTWNLPPFLTEVAAKHHDDTIVPQEHFFVATVALADLIATRMGSNVALELTRADRPDLASFFGLKTPEELEDFTTICTERVAMFSESLG